MAVNRQKLVSTPDSSVPPGAQVQVLRMADGVELRTALWPVREGKVPAGTIVLFHGRTEFIEKYYEVIGDLQDRGFAVLTFDWRGQGLSSRLLSHPLKGHVDQFSDYIDDARAVLDRLLTDDLPAPHILMAHSMGGNIALRFVHAHPAQFSCAILCAPMTGIKTAPFPKGLAKGIASAMTFARRGSAFVSRNGATHPRQEPFQDNKVTRDRDRFLRTIRLLEEEPALGLNGITWGWLREALGSCDRVMNPDEVAGLSKPIMLASAGAEQIVDGDTHAQLAERAPVIHLVQIADAEHEILQERDTIRAQFWTAFDAFIEKHAPPIVAADQISIVSGTDPELDFDPEPDTQSAPDSHEPDRIAPVTIVPELPADPLPDPTPPQERPSQDSLAENGSDDERADDVLQSDENPSRGGASHA